MSVQRIDFFLYDLLLVQRSQLLHGVLSARTRHLLLELFHLGRELVNAAVGSFFEFLYRLF